MKPGRLYLKIFLSFLIFLIITEVAIFGFFMLFAGRFYREQFEKQNLEKMSIAGQLIEKEVRDLRQPITSDLHSLQDMVDRLGIAMRAKIWLTETDDIPRIKSFLEPVPQRLVQNILESKEASQNRRWGKYRSHYLNRYMVKSLPMDGGGKLTLHVLFLDHMPRHSGWRFAVVLLGIGIIAALLVIPISRQISRPVKSLTYSARVIEKGDLSHRVDISTRDEIGELGKAFNRMADKVESMVNGGKELTAQISHELRSPLARIQLAVEMVKDRLRADGDAEIRSNLNDIQEDIGELDNLIGRILALSKLDLHETDYTADRFSAVDELETCLAKSRSLIEAKSVRLETHFRVKPEIPGNRDAMTTALLNIVDNAIKYTPSGGVITARSEVRDGRLLLALANTAAAVHSPDLARLFDPFFRINPGDSNGVGIGLTITRRIIEKHQGSITVTASEKSMEFTISLPIG